MYGVRIAVITSNGSRLGSGLSTAYGVYDLNAEIRESVAFSGTGDAYACGQIGVRSVDRSTLADANEARDWRTYAQVAQHLIRIARRLYVDELFGVDLKNTVYALDATTIDLCLALFPWAPFRSTKAAIKLHTLIDVLGTGLLCSERSFG